MDEDSAGHTDVLGVLREVGVVEVGRGDNICGRGVSGETAG